MCVVVCGSPYFLISLFSLSFRSHYNPPMPGTTPSSPPALNYAPVPLSPVRFKPLALAFALLAADCAFGLAHHLLLLTIFDYFPIATSLLIQMGVLLVHDATLLAAILILASALPPRGTAAIRWPVLACLAFALMHWLLMTAGFGLLLVRDVSTSFRPLVSLFLCWEFAILFSLALYLSAGIYLIAVATRLQRRSLGIAAAAALLPGFLDIVLEEMHFVTANLLHALHLPVVITPLQLPRSLTPANHVYFLLFWSALALWAAFRRRATRPHPAILPHDGAHS
jgi:hypothetical protein